MHAQQAEHSPLKIVPSMKVSTHDASNTTHACSSSSRVPEATVLPPPDTLQITGVWGPLEWLLHNENRPLFTLLLLMMPCCGQIAACAHVETETALAVLGLLEGSSRCWRSPRTIVEPSWAAVSLLKSTDTSRTALPSCSAAALLCAGSSLHCTVERLIVVAVPRHPTYIPPIPDTYVQLLHYRAALRHATLERRLTQVLVQENEPEAGVRDTSAEAHSPLLQNMQNTHGRPPNSTCTQNSSPMQYHQPSR